MSSNDEILDEIGSYPKMAATVEVVSTPDEAKPFFLIKNNRTRKFLKIGKNEYSILNSLDGINSIEDIYKTYEDRFSGDTIDQLIIKLYHMRLLEQDCVSPEEERKLGVIHRLVRNFTYEKLFKIKVNLLEPDEIIAKIYNKLKFFFHKYFLIPAALFVILGLVLFLLNLPTAVNVFWQGIDNGEILLVVFPMLLITVLHEFSHGLTTKHFGGVIYEMGFMLFYFRPAFYCNVTDSYRFNRWQRSAVNAAGVYFQLFLVACLLAGWQIAGSPLGVGGRFLLNLASFNILLILFNLIPLIKLDGYWILTTIVGIDNLRQKSFDFLNAVAANKIIGISKSKYILKQSSAKEKLVYAIYGISAIIFTIGFLFAIGLRIGGYIVLRFGTIGLVVFVLMVLILFLKAFKSIAEFNIDVFRGGMKSILRFVVLVALVVVVSGFILSEIYVEYEVEALYRLVEAKPGESHQEISDAESLIKVYLRKPDLNYIKKGQNVYINIYKNGRKEGFTGVILSDQPRKELYFNTGINVTANPSLFSGREKHVMLAKITNPTGLFKEVKNSTADVAAGRVTLGQYVGQMFARLIPD